MTVKQLGNETTTVYAEGAEFVMERIFDAPRELVWKALTEPERIPRWWGKRHTTMTVAEMEVRVGPNGFGLPPGLHRPPSIAESPLGGFFLTADGTINNPFQSPEIRQRLLSMMRR